MNDPKPIQLHPRPTRPKDGGRPHSDYRVLLVYPNIQQCALMPYAIGLFTALLRQDGFDVGLFDSTFYLNDINANYTHYQTYVRAFDWADKGVEFKKQDMLDDFVRTVDEYNPDLIAISVVENTYPIGRAMIRALPEKLRSIPVMWGGVFATFAPQLILNDNVGDFVCVGEGEHALVEFCRRQCAEKSVEDIPNLWVRAKNGHVKKNALGPAIVLNELPFPDYDLFEPEAIHRPMQGRIWRTLGIESQRGCPYTCTYCNSPGQNDLAKREQGTLFYRKKSLPKVMEEIAFLHKKYNIELIYWLVDTFLALSSQEFDELADRYMDFKIPFWMNTRPETMTEYRAGKLEEMNMLRMNFGIEHGNPQYREQMLKRRVKNETIINGFKHVAGRKFKSAGNCIIGMPEENRSLVFDTIKLCRELPKDIEKTGAFIFAPYHGTPLRDVAVKDGYLPPDTICDIQDPHASMLDQPQFRKQEVIGLARTFGLYQSVPESEWKWVEKAEHDTAEGRAVFERLSREYDVIHADARLDEG
ncbi:MAG: Radical superfamily enzyme YgiQ family [Betaproteobacteria bacterium]|nr:Radical superfamily enzyme YgiQ family [Betaproteobacteria bacterium]